MLVKRTINKTEYVLPVILNNKIKFNWYYTCENSLFKAYKQLLKINSNIRPCLPIISGKTYLNI